MAETEVEIVNKAASAIGHTDQLPDDGTQTLAQLAASTRKPLAQQAVLWYATTRDALLRRGRWPFATVRKSLQVAPGVTRDGWEYAYTLPLDCLRVWTITVPGVARPPLDQIPPHAIEAKTSGTIALGKLLLCNVEDAELLYTVCVDDPSLYPPDFESVLVEALAARLARALVKGADGLARARALTAETERLLTIAAVAARGEEFHFEDGPSSFERARS